MKLMVVLVLLIACCIFFWKWLLSAQNKAQAGIWTGRAWWSFLLALILVISAFCIASLTSWRIL